MVLFPKGRNKQGGKDGIFTSERTEIDKVVKTVLLLREGQSQTRW